MEFKSDKSCTWLEDKNGKRVAVLEYPELRPGIVEITHTEVDPSMSGQGIAGKITEHVANLLREDGRKAELSCSYAIKWFQKHPEYADVLADPEAEAEKAMNLGGPALSLKKRSKND